ncbi:MAG: hypothetical protein GY809_22235 [Planctomycetes bacterium]|nr:hypothetical protein [Planctomycetota bacterium]
MKLNRFWMVFVALSLWASSGWSALLVIENPSFESPHVDANAFQALASVDQWIETDNDTENSANTGVFPNPDISSPGHLANADGDQLAFLGSEQGNAIEQVLTDQFQSERAYRLTVSVGVSSMFPPSELNALELALYYVDGNEPVDIAVESVPAAGASSSELVDVSLTLPVVRADHAWAGQAMGIAIRSAGPASGFWDVDHVRVEEMDPVALPVDNASFEMPVVDPNAFQALPYVDLWAERDNDGENSANTGVFPNPGEASPGHLLHADQRQLAFLGSEQGNGLEQTVQSVYRSGCSYQLTVGVGVSALFPPSAENSLEVVFTYLDNNEPVAIVAQTVSAPDYAPSHLQDVTVNLGPVGNDDAWAGQYIGIAIRSVGPASGFWDLDHVRLNELLPTWHVVENPSFEGPAVDPNAFPVLPFADQWVEQDQDSEGSTNTGVFLNSPRGSDDHVINAQGLQLAYLGSAQGNAFEQELAVSYEAGSGYRLTVGVGVSSQLPPGQENALDMVMYYHDGNEPVTIVSQAVFATGLSSTHLEDVSVYLPTVHSDDAWAGLPIGVALRSVGPAVGFWDLDRVRLGTYNE